MQRTRCDGSADQSDDPEYGCSIRREEATDYSQFKLRRPKSASTNCNHQSSARSVFVGPSSSSSKRVEVDCVGFGDNEKSLLFSRKSTKYLMNTKHKKHKESSETTKNDHHLTLLFQKSNRRRNPQPPPRRPSFGDILIFVSFQVVFLLLTCAPPPATSQLLSTNNYNAISTQNRNSGQFAMSQLCSGKSNMPPIKRIEGGVLSSTHLDATMNCSVLFRTKSSHQHFILRFEELKLGCDDHLEIFDSDVDYGQSSMVDLSCRDNMASAPILKTTGTYLLVRYRTDDNSKMGDGFRAVITAVFDNLFSNDCPAEYTLCRSQLCISRSLFCDGINHCIDSSDEFSCNNLEGRNDLSYALALLILLILVISICVIVFIATIYCRRESPYAQYQHQLQRTLGVPIQTSSSLMFAANHQPQYQFFQPAQMSPYVTPQHHAAAFATLPRGYSTLPLNLTPQRQLANHSTNQQQHRQQQQQQHTILSKANNNNIVENNINGDYLLMTAYPGPPTSMAPTGTAMLRATNPATTAFQQPNMILSSSQSIVPTAAVRYTQAAVQGQNQRQ